MGRTISNTRDLYYEIQRFFQNPDYYEHIVLFIQIIKKLHPTLSYLNFDTCSVRVSLSLSTTFSRTSKEVFSRISDSFSLEALDSISPV